MVVYPKLEKKTVAAAHTPVITACNPTASKTDEEDCKQARQGHTTVPKIYRHRYSSNMLIPKWGRPSHTARHILCNKHDPFK